MKKARKQEKRIEVEVTRNGRNYAPLRRIVPKGTTKFEVGTSYIENALSENYGYKHFRSRRRRMKKQSHFRPETRLFSR